MDKALRNTLIAGITIVTLSMSYFFVVFLPNRNAMQLKQQELLKSSNAIKEEQNVEYIAPTNQIPDTTSVQPILNVSNAKQENQLNNNNESSANANKEAGGEYKKIQKASYEAQLKIDKEAYNSAIEKLTRDYEYARDKVNAEIIKNGLTEPYPDCSDGTRDEQRCQINNRAYAEYGIELDYLEKTYKANLKAIETTKYW